MGLFLYGGLKMNQTKGNVETKARTIEICNDFFEECKNHWIRDLESGRMLRDTNLTIDKQAKELALRDIKLLVSNPNSPNGKLLDKSAKKDALKQITIQNNLLCD